MRILLLFLSVLIFSQIQVFADEKEIMEKLEKNGTLETLRDSFKRYSVTENLEKSAIEFLAVKGEYIEADQKWYKRYPADETERVNIKKEARVLYNYAKCKNGSISSCKKFESEKNDIFSESYDFSKNKIIDIPKVDAKNGTFTTGLGEVYSAKTGLIIGKESIGKKAQLDKETNKEITAAVKDKKEIASEKDDSDFKCEWAAVFPRKILHGPGCKTGGSKICTGYVSCSWKNRKVNRLATCSERYCTDSTATECANQPGYGSKSVEGVKDQYQSDSQSTESNKVKSNQ